MVRGLLLLCTVLVPLVSCQDYYNYEDEVEVICAPPLCDLDCPHGLKVNHHGCEICSCMERECFEVDCGLGRMCRVFNISHSTYLLTRCVNPEVPDQCQQPMDAGPCKASMPMYYYEDRTDRCEGFIYGGCQGNTNLFRTQAECELACRPDKIVVKPGCEFLVCSIELECPNGFAVDENGCDICKCQEVDRSNKPSGSLEEDDQPCPQVDCDLHCPHGLMVDQDNCPLCECLHYPEVTYCPDDILETCGLECPEGYQKDKSGCDLCQCLEPASCPQVLCSEPCEFGYRKQPESGCRTCECREQGECDSLEQVCDMICDFGYKNDQYGCDMCQCNDDPCKYLDCPPGSTSCKLVNKTGTLEPVCVVGQSLVPSCPDVMCAMYCDNGFQTDKFGCEVCRCRDEPKECSLKKCEACDFGYAYDQNGCMTCQCLPDPCEALPCEDQMVCEAIEMEECPTCPLQSHCIEHEQVEAVNVRMNLAAVDEPIVQPLNYDIFSGYLRRELSQVFEMNETCIHDIHMYSLQVMAPDGFRIHVAFQMVRYENRDLVQIYESFRQQVFIGQLPNFEYEGARMMPEKESLEAHYSSRRRPLYQPAITEGARDLRVMFMIIGIALVGFIGVIVFILVLTAHRRRTIRAQNKPRKKNIIYKKALTMDQYKQFSIDAKTPLTIA